MKKYEHDFILVLNELRNTTCIHMAMIQSYKYSDYRIYCPKWDTFENK